MKVLLFLLSVISFLAGGKILMVADSALHEIEAFILIHISAVLLTGSAIVEAINHLKKDVIKVDEPVG
jgi:hypothetical protein